jgi:hypothetical protein
MVMLSETALGRVYQLCDERGRPIGRVVEPRDPQGVGPHAGTVLLVRDLPTPHLPFGRRLLDSQGR